MIELLINFFGGGFLGGLLALVICMFNNIAAFKKEDKVTAKEFLIWVIIGFILAGSLTAVIFTSA